MCDLHLDFMQVAEAMVREGQRVFITVDIDLYADLRALLPGMAVDDEELHKSLDTDPSTVCQLEAYYMLGDVTPVLPASFGTNACVRVAIETDDGRSIVIGVALYRPGTELSTYEPIVALERSTGHGPLVRKLVTRRHAQPARRHHGSGLCWI